MGHYDDCYSGEDFFNMSEHDKIDYYENFRKELNEKGFVWGTLDDVRGLILAEWANYFKYKIDYTNNSFIVKKD